MDQLEIKQKLLSGELSVRDAIAALTKPGKPWHTKEWKEKRDQKIGKACESCGSNNPPFVLQHKWHPPKIEKIYEEIRGEYSLTGLEPYSKSREEVVGRKVALRSIEYHQRYMDMLDEDIKTLCKKCAYIEDKEAGLVQGRVEVQNKNRRYSRGLNTWAEKVYGERWYETRHYESVADAFDDWLTKKDEATDEADEYE